MNVLSSGKMYSQHRPQLNAIRNRIMSKPDNKICLTKQNMRYCLTGRYEKVSNLHYKWKGRKPLNIYAERKKNKQNKMIAELKKQPTTTNKTLFVTHNSMSKIMESTRI